MEKGSSKAILGSVLISIIAVAGIGYFALPMIYPGIENEVDNDDAEVNPIAQVKILQLNTNALIWGNDTTTRLMNHTQMDITTEGGTYLSIIFSTILVLTIDSETSVLYNIFIKIDDEYMDPFGIQHYESNGVTGVISLTSSFNIMVTTNETVPAGIHSIGVYWRSIIDVSDTNSLSANHDPTYSTNIRTLRVEELRL